MPNLFEIAARKAFRFKTPQGPLTTEQLFQLPLTSTAGRANLNDIAIGIADELDKTGARSFVTTAKTDPAKTELNEKLELVKFVIADREAANEAQRLKADKKARRDKILDAIEAAETRELGSKSASDLRAELAALDD
jgi:hypothetical protein